MTIPYYEPYNGRRPLVERVPECRHGAVVTINGGIGISLPNAVTPGSDFRSFGTTEKHIAAALTRDAIKCWAAIEGDKDENCTPGKQNLVWLICAWVDHDGVNKYAHQFADTLGVAQ